MSKRQKTAEEARADYLGHMEKLATFCRQEADFLRAGGEPYCYAGNKLRDALAAWHALPRGQASTQQD